MPRFPQKKKAIIRQNVAEDVMMLKRVSLALFSAGLLIVMPLAADDVSDTIESALSAYKKGEFSSAAEDLSYALELIKQKKGENLKDYLPEPLSGWSAEEAQSQTAGAAMMGGGTTVSRSYTKGNSRIQIEVMTDSPMMQSFAMMFSNPMFATADGGKLIRVNRQKAVEKYDKAGRSGDIKMLVSNRFMITVNGSDVSEEVLEEYAKAIDLRKLSAMQ
jgi:hypothetical protein